MDVPGVVMVGTDTISSSAPWWARGKGFFQLKFLK